MNQELKEKLVEIISKDPFLKEDGITTIQTQEMIWDEQADQLLSLFSQEQERKIKEIEGLKCAVDVEHKLMSRVHWNSALDQVLSILREKRQ